MEQLKYLIDMKALFRINAYTRNIIGAAKHHLTAQQWKTAQRIDFIIALSKQKILNVIQ